MSWNVLITARVFTKVGKPALDLLKESGCNVLLPEQFGPLKEEPLLKRLPGMDAVLCSPDAYNAAVLQSEAAKDLKIISRWGVGYDTIDVAEATRQGIAVAYTPGMLNETVADWTWALLLGIARRVHEGEKTVRAGEWTNHWGHNVHDKTLGLIGCGRIGQAVAKRASGFNMRVIAHDIAPPAQKDGIEFVSLDELLAQSHFVSLHAALTPQNRGLIGEAQLRKMKPDAYLINTARGPLIDELALAKALQEGWIAGAALDVFSAEPLPLDNPLRAAPNLLMTPHLASFTRETGDRVCLAAAQAIVDSLNGRRARWVVDEKVYQSPKLRVKVK